MRGEINLHIETDMAADYVRGHLYVKLVPISAGICGVKYTYPTNSSLEVRDIIEGLRRLASDLEAVEKAYLIEMG